MKKYLRHIRIIVSSIIFLLFIHTFMNIGFDTPIIRDFLLSLQVLPVWIKMVVSHFSFISIPLILVLLLTLIFGRIYCSTLCPLGTFQDVIISINNDIQSKKKYKYIRIKKSVRYIILVLVIVSIFLGYMVFISLLGPYSIFGRIMTNILKPLIIVIMNLLSKAFNSFQLYLIPQFQIHHISYPVLLFALLYFIFIVIMTYFRGRWFCNHLCPVGTILGSISCHSFYKIHFTENCNHCGLCENKCKAGCINSKNKKIDLDRCINCFDCLSVCPRNGLEYSIEKKKIDLRKRKLITGILLPLFSAFLLPVKSFSQMLTKSRKLIKKNPITPPGSKNHDHFNSTCISCYLCVSSCPNHVIIPTMFKYGIKGILQPELNYSYGYCSYECNICSQVCPNHAIEPISIKKKKLIQIGIVNHIKDNCIVYSKNLPCGACSEHCPTKAVYLVPYKSLEAPAINTKICIGCGACENICPAKPNKAIYVEGNKVHKSTRRPKKKQRRFKKDSSFPF